MKNAQGVETIVKRFDVKVQTTSSTASPSSVAPTSAPQAASDPKVAELQKLLTKRGFYTGKVDGVLTQETRNATIRAQNFYTISPADGSPSNALIDKLNSDTFISEGN